MAFINDCNIGRREQFVGFIVDALNPSHKRPLFYLTLAQSGAVKANRHVWQQGLQLGVVLFQELFDVRQDKNTPSPSRHIAGNLGNDDGFSQASGVFYQCVSILFVTDGLIERLHGFGLIWSQFDCHLMPHGNAGIRSRRALSLCPV